MKKYLLQLMTVTLFSLHSFGTASVVYHERTLNSPSGSCGYFVSNLNPSSTDAVTIEFTIDMQYFTNRACVYYTTDGSNPTGSYGTVSGTTRAIMASYFCNFDNGDRVIDVARATLPANPNGTTIKYIVSAWHTVKGVEVFGNSTDTTSATAVVYSYSIPGSVLPLTNINFSGQKVNNTARLTWTTAQEINVDHYEVYRSSNGIQFEKTATRKAAGNTSSATTYTIDDNPVKGNNFYKIKSVDIDGKFNYTAVIKIVIDEKDNVSVRQIGNILQISLSSIEKEHFTIRLVNNAGQMIKSESYTQVSPGQNLTMTLPAGLLKGVYHVALNSTNSFYKQSLFIQ